MDETHIHDITRVIQLALAPAFLLTAVGSLLNVFANRLARIVDRYRTLRAPSAPASAGEAAEEILVLEHRATLVRWAITLGTGAALFVSLVIGLAFLGFILQANFSRVVAALFVSAMAALTVALGCFLREVTVAIGILEAPAARRPPAARGGGGGAPAA
ncbi:MAG TPA: DUF2721 domain-containing protein [Anaeromyxobacteraceae bacterium]|nr:DUF2721 domain-containing protein [Anaeromyxobacteraceae bacterium]